MGLPGHNRGFQSLIKPCIWDPARFVKTIIRATPDPWQVKVMKDLVTHKRGAVAGCNGSGKDALATWIALWALTTRPYCKGQVTGPNRTQVFDTVWPEAKKWIDNSPILPHLIQWSKSRISWKEDPDRWFISARTAAKHFSSKGDVAAEGIQGMHEDHLIIIITEASGVEDQNWEAAESCCTRPDNYLLAVGNPLRRSGRFYDIFTHSAYSTWFKQHVAYTDSSYVDSTRAQEWINRYGIHSAFCQVRCMGQFPAEGSPDAAISWELVSTAMDRDSPGGAGDLQLGVDCARYGGDEFAIAIRRGMEILPLLTYHKISGPQGVGHVIEALLSVGGTPSTPILIDEAGLGGAGIVDPLLNQGYNAIGINNITSAQDTTRYEKWDDEQWLETVPKWLAAGGVLPRDDTLLAQLTTRKYEFTGKNEQQRRLESKKRLRGRGISSPDRAESIIMAIAPAWAYGSLGVVESRDGGGWRRTYPGGGGLDAGGWNAPESPDRAKRRPWGMANDEDDDEGKDVADRVLDGLIMH